MQLSFPHPQACECLWLTLTLALVGSDLILALTDTALQVVQALENRLLHVGFSLQLEPQAQDVSL